MNSAHHPTNRAHHPRRSASWPAPYVGSRHFDRTDAYRFFGRRAETLAAKSLWLENRLVVVHGASAVGKTSLLLAGVLPLLEDTDPAPDMLPVAQLAPTTVSLPDPAIDRNRSSYSVLRVWAQVEGPSIPATSFTDFLLSRSDRACTQQKSSTVLAAIDQFGRIFDVPQYERNIFIRELGDALRNVPQLNLLVIIDDGSLEQFRLHQKQLWAEHTAYFQLTALDPANALQAVTRPLAGTGHSFHAGAADEFVAQLVTASSEASTQESVHDPTPRVEPLILQLACVELWSRLSLSEQIITSDLLHDLGDINAALRHFYDAVIHGVHLTSGKPENQLRGWIEGTFITKSGMPRSARLTAGLTAGMPQQVVDTLAQKNFLAIERRPRRKQCKLALAAFIPAIREVNQMWRSVSGLHALDYKSAAVMPGAFTTAARDALAEGDLAGAQSFALLAAERYRQVGDEWRFAHALILRGDIARARGEFDIAAEDFQVALSRFSILQDRNLTVRALCALGEIGAMEGDYRKAEQFQRLAVDYLPTDVDALIGLGYAQWYGGSPADAEATFTQALAWDATAALAIAGRGQVRAEMGEYESALSDLDQALSASLEPPDEADARSSRAVALAGLGRSGEAAHELDAAHSQVPRARTFLRSARVAMISGHNDTALVELERAFDADPPLSPAEDAAARRMLKRLHSTDSQDRAS